MNESLDIEHFTEEILLHNVFDFMRFLRKRMPETFITEKVSVLTHEKSMEVRFNTKRQMMLSSIVRDLKLCLELNTLYSFSKDHGKVQDSTLYHCYPEGESYLVYVHSGMYGVLDNVVFEFYTNYDAMCDKLCEEFQRYRKYLNNSFCMIN